MLMQINLLTGYDNNLAYRLEHSELLCHYDYVRCQIDVTENDIQEKDTYLKNHLIPWSQSKVVGWSSNQRTKLWALIDVWR